MHISEVPLVPEEQLTEQVAAILSEKYGPRFHKVNSFTFPINPKTGVPYGGDSSLNATVRMCAAPPNATIIDGIDRHMKNPDLHLYFFTASECVCTLSPDGGDRYDNTPIYEVEGCRDPRTLEVIPGKSKVRVMQTVRYTVVPINSTTTPPLDVDGFPYPTEFNPTQK